MKPKLIALTLSLLVAFGLSGCAGYAVIVNDTPPERDHQHHHGDERPGYYNPPPQAEPSVTHSPAPRARERVPSNVPPPQPQHNSTPNQQPRVREQSPTTPPPKAPTPPPQKAPEPRPRSGNISYNANGDSGMNRRLN